MPKMNVTPSINGQENELGSVIEELSAHGYLPAQGAKLLAQGEQMKVVALCREFLRQNAEHTSVRLLLARAQYQMGQIDSATEQFRQVLSNDPDNLVALKHLGDIKFARGDHFGALSDYERILEIDPNCRGLFSALANQPREKLRTITLRRSEENSQPESPQSHPPIFFHTETMGDLYLEQGHAWQAVEVFRKLLLSGDSERVKEKLSLAEARLSGKERLKCPERD